MHGILSFPLISAATNPNAEQILADIKHQLERNQALADDYPEICDPILALDGTAQRGATQTANGKRTFLKWAQDYIVLPTDPTPPAALAEVPLADPEAPEPALPPVMKIVREISAVLIEVPLCDNPPGLDGTPSFCKAHVNLQLIKSRSPTGRNILHRLWWGLKETGAKLANGRKVFNRNDAVVWLIERLDEHA